MADNDLNQKPLPESPDPVVNPEDETRPQSAPADGGNEGEGDEPPPSDPPPGGDHPTKRPEDPAP